MENKYILELAKQYPDKNKVSSEIINLNAILALPKGTEHFLSDLHGEYEAFLHIRKNASGVIRNKVDQLFSKSITLKERKELATLIYYPEEKLHEIEEKCDNFDDWCNITLERLLEISRLVSSKYTRSKVRKHLKKTAMGFDYIIDELLNNDYDALNKDRYYENILKTVMEIGASKRLITALCELIKSLVIDHLHIVGDIFDRGPRADIILDELMNETSLDIQWGNHDALWMGAAAGSAACIASVLNNSITYRNLDVLEIGYGISLRPLTLFAQKVYKSSDVTAFMPKGNSKGEMWYVDDDVLLARMHKAISIIQFKLEGRLIKRNPDFDMDERCLLEKIENGTVTVDNVTYKLKDSDFPTLIKSDPYLLTDEEEQVITYLKNAFLRSEKLQKHVRFLFEKGGMYKIFNSNLLFHGCVPMNNDGTFMKLKAGKNKCGRALLDEFDFLARQGYFMKDSDEGKERGRDILWFLWCGKDSPLCARKKVANFERLLIDDEQAWFEEKNAYYPFRDDEKTVSTILSEFGLDVNNSHIINGHIPVRYASGELPVKANGRVIVIDGGFSSAYRSTTGIAGYTLIYNASGMRISAHEPFSGTVNAIKNNVDVVSDTVIFEQAADSIRVRDTDIGKEIEERINDLKMLLKAYEKGEIKAV
ncbi:MAG: fructose-1,6-bisphosphatase [Clostridia bacterium]|nr:fructose-1,6-bisphosphatase [Clostridia bacterium]